MQLEKRTISFNAKEHKYSDEKNTVYTSVTTVIGFYKKAFDSEYWAAWSMVRDSGLPCKPSPETREIIINNKHYTLEEVITSSVLSFKYTVEELKAEWAKITADACARGNETHDYLEDSINMFSNSGSYNIADIKDLNVSKPGINTDGYALKITNIEELENSPMQLKYPTVYEYIYNAIMQGFTLYAEKRVYNPILGLAGMIDVFLAKGKHFIILDWKTNKDLLRFESGYYKKAWKDVNGVRRKVRTEHWIKNENRLLYPIGHLDECKGSVYSMQLSLYAFLCECWGMVQLDLQLCHIRRNEDVEFSPLFYQIPYLKEEVKNMLVDFCEKNCNTEGVKYLNTIK